MKNTLKRVLRRHSECLYLCIAFARILALFLRGYNQERASVAYTALVQPECRREITTLKGCTFSECAALCVFTHNINTTTMERDILWYYPTSPPEAPFRTLLTCPKPLRYSGIPANFWRAFFLHHLRMSIGTKIRYVAPWETLTYSILENEQ